jgi:hypothetical protein
MVDVFEYIDSNLSAQDAAKAINLALQPPSHTVAVQQMTEACKVGLTAIEGAPFAEAPVVQGSSKTFKKSNKIS